MLRRSIGEAEFEEVIPRHLLIDHLLNHVVVIIVIDGRIDEKINNKPGDGGDGGYRHGVRVKRLGCGAEKITLEFKRGERILHSHTFLTTKI